MANYQQVRKSLEAELREVMGTSERIGSHLRNEDRTLPQDAPDLAQFLNNDEVLQSLGVRSRERIDDLRQAITRIDEGVYDTCALCGATIESERLEVLPTTRICAECAERVPEG